MRFCDTRSVCVKPRLSQAAIHLPPLHGIGEHSRLLRCEGERRVEPVLGPARTFVCIVAHMFYLSILLAKKIFDVLRTAGSVLCDELSVKAACWSRLLRPPNARACNDDVMG